MTSNPTAKADVLRNKEKSWLRHTAVTALITAAVTISAGISGAIFSDWLNNRAKTHDLDLAATRRAIGSVENMTNLIFERDARAGLVASSIKRASPKDELNYRKRLYDETFIKYNSNLQSNLFNIRDIFHTVNYTTFEDLLEGPLRDLFIAEDRCITAAYDAAASTLDVSTSGTPPSTPSDNKGLQTLQTCVSGQNIGFDEVHASILHCEYVYTDNLFRVVASKEGIESSLSPRESDIRQACAFPAQQRQTAAISPSGR